MSRERGALEIGEYEVNSMALGMHCFRFVMNDKNAAVECEQCIVLLSRYEAATFAEARLHNAQDIASHIGNPAEVRSLEIEAEAITARRTRLREALVLHEETNHGSAPQPVTLVAAATANESH
jgi:hypothetical protein